MISKSITRLTKKYCLLLVDDGANDSDSERWIELDEINVENSSPLVLKIKQELLGEEQLDKVIYSN